MPGGSDGEPTLGVREPTVRVREPTLWVRKMARPRETVGVSTGAGLCEVVFGGVLLSHNPSVAVPSALSGLASGFGMGPGVPHDAITTETL